MLFWRTGAAATLLAVATCAVALVSVSDAAPTAVGSFEDLIRNRPPLCGDGAPLGALERNSQGDPCSLGESDEHPFVLVPLEPLGADLDLLTSVDDAEAGAVLTPSTPWDAADGSVPVYRGSSVGSKAWYRGVAAARDEDADDSPTRLSFSLFHEEQEPVVLPAEDFPRGPALAKDLATDGVKVSFLEDSEGLAHGPTGDPIRDVIEELSNGVTNEFPVEETTESLGKGLVEIVPNLPDDPSSLRLSSAEAEALAGFATDLGEYIEVHENSSDRDAAGRHHRDEELADDSPARTPWRIPAGHHFFADEDFAFVQRAAEDLDEDVIETEDLAGIATDLSEHRDEQLADESPARMPWRIPAGHHPFADEGFAFDQGVAEDPDEDVIKVEDLDGIAARLSENLEERKKSFDRGAADRHHRDGELADDSPARMPWRIPAGHHLFAGDDFAFAQGVAEDPDEDVTKDLTAENLL